MKFLSCLLPRSLFAHLALLFAGAFILLHLLIFFTLTEVTERQMLQNALDKHSAALVLAVRQANAAQGVDEVTRFLPMLKALEKLPEFSAQVSREKPLTTQGQDALSLSLLTRMQETAAKLHGGERMVRTLVTDSHTAPFDDDDGECYLEEFLTSLYIPACIETRSVVQLDDGYWLTITHAGHVHDFPLPTSMLLLLTLEFSGMAILVLACLHRIVHPLKQLAETAELFGTPLDNGQPLREEGPREIRNVAQSFNSLRTRINSIIDKQAGIFATLSHDLRTPLTRMRLRLENMPEGPLRKELLADIESLQGIVETSSALIHHERHTEPALRVDIQAFLEAVVEDRIDMGEDVTLEGEAHFSALIYPIGLRRCLDNLLDNAMHYSSSAVLRVHVERRHARKKMLCIDIRDDGPGIPEELLDKVFAPLFRLESARERNPGGKGLGLSIARTVAHQHGGELRLHNYQPHGLCASLRIPLHAKNTITSST